MRKRSLCCDKIHLLIFFELVTSMRNDVEECFSIQYVYAQAQAHIIFVNNSGFVGLLVLVPLEVLIRYASHL